jgi:ribose/xylose/arabinose/galactoside ABC-type transport system permease subunit
MEQKMKRSGTLSLLGSNSEIRIALLIILTGIVMSVVSSYFLRLGNIIDLLESVAILSVLAFCITFVALVGELDISVGSIMAMAAITTNVMLSVKGMPFYVALLGGIGAGLVIGILNGTLTVVFGFPSLIVTLAMMSILRGIVYVITGSAPLPPYDSKAYFAVGNGEVLGLIPVPVIIALSILVIVSLMLFKTRFGRVMLLTGANRKAANIAGVNTRQVLFVSFAACGLLAGVAGMLLGSKLKSVFPEFGMGYELRAITAAVIGGVSLFGGRGSFVGSFLGAVLIGLIFNIIDLLALDPYWQFVVIGLMVLIAVLSDKLVYNLSMKRTSAG